MRALPLEWSGDSGFLRRTMTETVILLEDGAGTGVWAEEWRKGALWLPGSVARAEAERDLLVDGLLLLALVLMGRSPNLGMNLACQSVCEKSMVCHGCGRGINVAGIFCGVGVREVCDRRSEIDWATS